MIISSKSDLLDINFRQQRCKIFQTMHKKEWAINAHSFFQND